MLPGQTSARRTDERYAVTRKYSCHHAAIYGIIPVPRFSVSQIGLKKFLPQVFFLLAVGNFSFNRVAQGVPGSFFCRKFP
jgi:hypothetical protein